MKILRGIFDERTVIGLTGLALTAGGLALVYLPLALIVPGAAIFVLAVWRLR